MTLEEKQTLRACRAICRKLAEEALMRIDASISEKGDGERDAWLKKEAIVFRRLLYELGVTEEPAP